MKIKSDLIKMLNNSSEVVSRILTYINDVIVITDETDLIRYKSPNITRIFGWRPDELIGRNAWENVHPDDIENTKTFMKQIRTTADHTLTHELRYLCKDGTYKWIEFSATNLLQDPDIQGVLGSYHDISNKKIEETKRTRSSELLANLAKLVPGVIYQYRLDPDGHSAFPYASPGISDIYEVEPDEVKEDASPVFTRLHPEDTEMVSSKIIESARTLENFYCEFRVLLPRQGLRWRWSQAFPEKTAEGGTLWHGIIMDITDRKEAEEKEQRLQEQLTQSQKMESVGRLAGGVAHDFNNMLGVIIGYAEMLHDSTNRRDPSHAALSEILIAADRSAKLTQQLLAFSRQQTVSPKPLNVNEMISDMTAMLSRLIGEQIQLKWQEVPELWMISLDPSQFHQIMINLCVNARDAIGTSGTISISADNTVIETDTTGRVPVIPSGKYVRLIVTDSGSGMSETVQKHLFEPFFTTKPMGKGTGLGLSTIYGIIKQNNGYIHVESKEGKGTSFHLYFKRHISIATPETMPAANASAYMHDATILLTEDEPGLLAVATSMLKSGGYKVLPTSNPERAIEVAKQHPTDIHLLLTDVIMPNINGRELYEKIIQVRPRIRCLFTSGYTADVIGPHGVLEKGVMFIPKPFTKKQLLDKVKESLGIRLNV